MAFRERTTFVIGAGASVEFGLPVGNELATAIKKTAWLDGDDRDTPSQRILRTMLDNRCRSGTEFATAKKALLDIHEGIQTAVSIDAFIHRHKSDPNISFWGKVLIALEVLNAERNSSMSALWWDDFAKDPKRVLVNGEKQLISPDETWIGHFLRILADGVADYNSLGKEITIICFNYDRCIEVYLAETIADAYRIPIESALKVVNENIRIIHPYGSLGEIALTSGSPGKDRLGFGLALERCDDIIRIAENIRTYTEQTHHPENVWAIHKAMTECQNLIFLGFGFNNQNLDLLRVKNSFNNIGNPKNIYSTGVGLFPQVEETLTRRILDLYMDEPDHAGWRSRVKLEFDIGCKELFRRHDMNFSSFKQHYIELVSNDDGTSARFERYRPRSRNETHR